MSTERERAALKGNLAQLAVVPRELYDKMVMLTRWQEMPTPDDMPDFDDAIYDYISNWEGELGGEMELGEEFYVASTEMSEDGMLLIALVAHADDMADEPEVRVTVVRGDE
jgi:hypothetical protein